MFVFYHYQVIWVLYVFSVLTPYQIYDLQTSFPFSKLSLWVFFYDFLCCAEAFWFDVVPFYFAFVSFAWGDISKKILLRPMLKNMLCFLVGVLCFRSYIQVFNPFWVDFCEWYNIVVQFHSFVYVCPVFPTPFIERIVPSPRIFWCLCWKLTKHVCVGLFLGFLVQFHWSMCLVLMPIPYCFDYYSFVKQFEIKEGITD